MQLLLTKSLNITSKNGVALELFPVHMENGFPSRDPGLWLDFLYPPSKENTHELSAIECEKAQDYMRKHQTEALSEDGEKAFTIAGDRLVRCKP
ncbi:hypothetical protein [Hydrogenophaga sp. NFH-34]|uniref:hypothetical protein n=1 Tax=Hydrogenophaga sp. NFH-34 TaxID=2744446 RepID=UPI001F1C677F|nr:hypothetical protein [Hydrogenophaga sp. NFH-34]